MAQTQKLSDLLTSLDDEHEGSDVSINDILETFHSRSFGPLLVMPPLIALVLPVFGLPSVCGVITALVAIQLVMGRNNPWLPKRIRHLSIDGQRYHRVVEKAQPWVKRLERLFKPRLSFMNNAAAHRITALLIVLISLCIPFVEPLPLAPALPCSMLLLIALGMMARDGLVMLIGLTVALAGMISLFLML
ncbi:ABC transporter permease [Kushneria pakistanensis]|uniref:ABC transporter permease n=1 Tax=Kushneria pakistanensis TaxID=1508770 RepID=A0ABQ3FCG8_9GAMM|nr:exopolysaccharide biosynthesis protein [Kushneria pakistanensis]GHC18335.1 ABC transporter permease [Kushneria pakistanensis]